MPKPKSQIASFSYTDTAENQRLLALVDELAQKDARPRSWVILQAIREYAENHAPGNPQTDIRTYPAEDGEPALEKPKTVQKAELESFITRHADAITFLMKTKNIPQDEAVEIVRRLYPED